MPLYRITAPNGQTYQIEGPEGASDAEVAQAVLAQFPEAGTAPKQSTIGSELVRGGRQLASSIRTGIEAAAGSPEEAAQRGLARSQVIGYEAGEGPSFEAVKRAYQDRGLLPAAGEALSQIPRALAGQGAQLGTMAAGARLGAMAGSAVAPGVGTLVGGALGAGATLLPQFFGSNVERQAAEQTERGEPVQIDRAKAAAAAAGQAAIEGAGTAFTLGKGVIKGVLGIADDAALATAKAQRELVKTAERSLAGTVGRGVARGTTEMPVEVAQQVLERAQAGLDLLSEDALKEYGESAYQAALIGGPLGGVGNVVSRSGAREQVARQEAQTRAAEAQARAEEARKAAEEAQRPKLEPEAGVGTQGTLFAEEEMGPKVEAPALEPAAEATAVPEGQMDLGLDYARKAEDVTLEIERLKRLPQTPEVAERIATLSDDLQTYSQLEVERIRAEKEDAAAAAKEEADTRAKFPALANAPELMAQSDEVKARTQGELFPGEDLGVRPTAEPTTEPTLRRAAEKGPRQLPLGLRRNPEGQPTTFGQPEPTFTSEDVLLTAIPVRKGMESWIDKNVIGSTRTQLLNLIERQPELVRGNDQRAKLLRALTAVEVPAFKESPRDTSRTQAPAVEQGAEPRTGEPSVGVPSEPTATQPAGPRARVARPAGKPAAPVGLGLVPAGQPAGAGTQAQGSQPTAVDEEAQRQREAAEMAAALARQQGGAGRDRVAPPRVQVTPTTPTTQPIPEKLYEPIGTSEIGMEEGQKEILRGPQAMLFPMSKREELEYAERPRGETEAAAAGPEAIRDERQLELPLRAAPKKKAAPAPKAAQPKELAIPTKWAGKHALGAQVIVYEDPEVALVRDVNAYGDVNYFPMDSKGTQAFYTLDAKTQPTWLTAEQAARLRAAQAEAEATEAALHAKNPQGPFASGETVVGAKSVDPALVGYATNLLRSLGLGDLKLFIYTNADKADAGFIAANGLYGPFARPAQFKDNKLNGSAGRFGTEPGTYAIYLNSGLSEGKTIEILAHEVGHIIEKEAYDNADDATRTAITNEYLAWRKQAKGATAGEFVQMLRNREDAQTNLEALQKAGRADDPAANTLQNFNSYWLGFGEWFADNVSRWATTNEKPLSIADKFFAKVAQKMRDLVALVTGRKYPPAKSVADYLNKMGPADFRPFSTAEPVSAGKDSFSVSVSTEALIDSMGPLELEQKTGLKALIPSFKAGMSPADPGYAVKFRTQTADAAATVEHRLREQFDGAVRDSMGKLNPMGLYRQAQDHAKMLLEYFQTGGLVKDKTTGLWRAQAVEGVRPPADVYALIDAWGAKHGYSRERATQIASRILEGVRLNELLKSNPDFPSHMRSADIAQLVREYDADPDLQAMSKLMDEARVAMVDNMVAVGRLTKETGEAWKEAIGYVPFDRLEDETFNAAFSKVKKISNKGLAQVGKLPELVGSIKRPVGNVFENYLNTLGWMVGQTMKTDGTVQTLRSLEDIGQASFLGRSTQSKPNTVGMYVGGEMMYWELPSKYDVLAFKDLNPPKAGWLRMLGQFSNVLRTSVTALPPFALKQVTDDVQRAILTSGVRNPGALLRMSLSNFGGLALAELRGIQHPTVREFGALGLTGEYDFQAGKPATSLLKDLGYKPRGKFETLMHRLEGVTRASDLAVRKAIYEQTLKETGDQVLAQTRAREFINFRRRGASDFVGAMVTTIPFFNAYIQGMDVLYRAASGKDSSSSVGRAQARRLFWSRAATVMMLSSLYALGKDDDEDYAEMDLRTRDSNWILPGGYKIPVPGELGALFKVVPERVVEYMRRQGTPEEQTAWEATRTALSYIFEQYIGRTVPVPQAVKPLLEAWTNHSFFTGRELEGIYQKQQDPSMRRASNTSELAIAIAAFARDVVGVDAVSPILVDNALNGYFGSSAGLLVAMTDSLLNPSRVDRPLHKWALLSNYMYDPVGTRRMTEFYEEREKVGRANATLNELMKTDMDRAAAYAEAHADELMLEGAINSTLEQLERTRAYRKYLNSPDGAAEMSKEEREKELQELRRMEVEFTSWLREAKAAIR